jgi:hypothetical protein
VRYDAQKPDGRGAAVFVPVTDSGRNKHAVAGSDLHLARVKSQDHRALENDLLVFDVIVAMTRNAASRLESELSGDEVLNPALWAEQDLQRCTSAARNGNLFYRIQGADHCGGWMAHGDLQGWPDCTRSGVDIRLRWISREVSASPYFFMRYCRWDAGLRRIVAADSDFMTCAG